VFRLHIKVDLGNGRSTTAMPGSVSLICGHWPFVYDVLLISGGIELMSWLYVAIRTKLIPRIRFRVLPRYNQGE
jgi:hypothetical protein